MRAELRSGAAAAADNPVIEKGARLGFAASGVLHLLIAWLAVRLAWFGVQGEVDQGGALTMIAGSAAGSAILWLCVVGFVLLALWQVTDAIVRRDTGDRLKAAGKALVYLALAATAFSVVQTGSDSGGASGMTATLMAKPYGQVLVGAIGLGVIGVGAYHVLKGVKRSFLQDLREHPGAWTARAGQLGYVAKGVALGLVGGLFVAGAMSRTAQDAGLDAALKSLLELPMGAVLLTLVGLGLAAYGLYSFARARFARV